MESNRKYALLDTDFLYKSHLARNASNQTLAELVIRFNDYEFFCHEIIKKELARHEIYPDPNPWLEEKIKSGRVKQYSDRDIMNELKRIYGSAATFAYISMLRISCDTFHAGFFKEYYGALEETDAVTNIDYFLKKLKRCDDQIPHKKGLGEKKTYVLIQMLEILYNKQVYVFCSDDFRARQSIAGLSKPVNCISILGVFYKLMKMGYVKAEIQEHYECLSAFLKNQKEYKVWSLSGHQRIKVPVAQVLDDIYDGRFQLLRNGDLQYIK